MRQSYLNKVFFIIIFFLPAWVLSQTDELRISIYFGGGSYYIDREQAAELSDFINSFSNLKGYEINVSSHTDNIGGKAFNEWLSRKRSDAVYKELLRLNVSPSLIRITDFGQENPVYDNAFLEGRLKNRRVDVILHPLIF